MAKSPKNKGNPKFPPKSQKGVAPKDVRKQIHGTSQWFNSLTPEQQAAYLERYPNSKFGKK